MEKTIDQIRSEYLEEGKGFCSCFTETIWSKVNCLQTLKTVGRERSNVFKKVREALSDDLKKFTDKSVTPRASVKAFNKFKELGLGSIFEQNWNTIGSIKVMKALAEKGRNIFHHEHLQPHSEYIDSVLIKCTASHHVYCALKDYPGVCWILKSEDKEITALKFRSKRIVAGGWQEVYKIAGIEVLSIFDSNFKF